MVSSEIINIIESLIFASVEEITIKDIKEILNSFKLEIKSEEIEETVEELNDRYEKNNNAFRITQVAGGYTYSTRKEYAQYVGKLYSEIQKKRLSQSAIETLSIISYQQPVTRSQIEFVRGVNVDYIVNSLLERDLIKIVGRENSPGRPILYGSTNKFLKVLGLNSLDDLPKLKEINEILKTEKLEGLSQADIDLYHSVNEPEKTTPDNQESQETISDDEKDDTSTNESGLAEKFIVTDLENTNSIDDEDTEKDNSEIIQPDETQENDLPDTFQEDKSDEDEQEDK